MKLDALQLQLKQDVAALKSDNRKLHRKLASMQAENLSLKRRVSALEKQRKKLDSSPLIDMDKALDGIASDLLSKIRK